MSVREFPSPVESVDALSTFCSQCGRRLVVEDRTAGFDQRTGAPILTAYAYCRGSWIERLIFGFRPHDSFVVMPRPPVGPPQDFGTQGMTVV